jgi:2-(1,2-epoxy-1,2-dihydrophenyl)acetyl-CoA isomerase
MSAPTSPQAPVQIMRDGAVVELRLNRPAALNALDIPTALAFLAACRDLAADASVRAVVVSGAGKAFGVGGDLSTLRGEGAATVGDLIAPLHEAVLILAALDAPVIASVHGSVAGGSMSLMLACDLALAAEGTRFNLAYTAIGASCDVSGSWHLPRMVGLRNAMRIALLSEGFDAAEALRLGLLTYVFPAPQLAEQTRQLAQRLAAGPTRAYGRMKRLLRQSFEHDLPTQLEAEREAFCASAATRDFGEGLEAFFARRSPQFEGR